jgi:hypothetical protein
VNSLVKNSIRFALFLLLQIVVLNEVPPVHRFIIPYLYFLYLLWLPFSINRFSLLIVAFVFGLSLDYFTGTIGLHAAPCICTRFSLFFWGHAARESRGEKVANAWGCTQPPALAIHLPFPKLLSPGK